MMEVSMEEKALPRLLFEGDYEHSPVDFTTNYDLGADGRFLMVRATDDDASRRIHVVSNWFTELDKLVPQ